MAILQIGLCFCFEYAEIAGFEWTKRIPELFEMLSYCISRQALFLLWERETTGLKGKISFYPRGFHEFMYSVTGWGGIFFFRHTKTFELNKRRRLGSYVSVCIFYRINFKWNYACVGMKPLRFVCRLNSYLVVKSKWRRVVKIDYYCYCYMKREIDSWRLM